MDEGLDGGRQWSHARLVVIRYVQAEKVDQALVEECRLTVGCQATDGDRDHVDELRKLPLPVAQRFLCAHLIIDVERNSIPLRNRSVFVTSRLHPALRPAIDAIFFAPAEPHSGAAAGGETIPQRVLHLGSVFGMNQLLQQFFDARLSESFEVRDNRAEMVLLK